MDSDNNILTSHAQAPDSGCQSLPFASVPGPSFPSASAPDPQHVLPSYPLSTLQYYYPAPLHAATTHIYPLLFNPLILIIPLWVTLGICHYPLLLKDMFLHLDIHLLFLPLKIYILNLLWTLLFLTVEIMSISTIHNAYNWFHPLLLLLTIK